MSKKINNLVIVMLATVVFFTGAGVTVINLCCSNCKIDIFFVEDNICCSSYNNTSDQIELRDCCSEKAESIRSFDANSFNEDANEHCSTARISIDINSSTSRPNIAIPFVWSSDLLFTPQYSLFQSKECPNKCERLEAPPIITPRTYLSIIKVLVI